MLHTPICDALGIIHPICQAGMANYTSPELVAAVSRAGGLGFHGALGREPESLRALLRATRVLLDDEPFGVNHVLGRFDEAAFAVCLEERVPVYCFSWGDPGPWVGQARATGAKVVAQVTTVSEAAAARAAGVDAIVAQGTEGGGHSGFIALAELLPAVVAAAGTLPVLAAGGIVDGAGLAAALALGAAGGWLGTRFLATPEAPISPAWKAAILAAQPGDTVHTAAFDQLWGQPWPGARVRAIRNRFTDAWAGRETLLLAQRESIQAAVWQAERDDDPSLFALMAGSGVGAIDELLPAGAIVQMIVAQTAATIGRLTGYMTSQPMEREGKGQ
ncbi:MAG TPA: nitronate monooxygenase [Thermomicrobiales bacterium]|jgi:NAD(P)H-dependent flavin oxidoreductase YrpB (nitropropane dioxygenase family)